MNAMRPLQVAQGSKDDMGRLLTPLSSGGNIRATFTS